MVGKARNSTEEENWGTIFSALHFHVVWSSLLTSQLAKFPSSTQLTPFWYTNSIPFGEISDYLFLSLRLEMMITFVLRLILLRKLVLFSFHMLRSFKRVSQKTRKQQKEGHTVPKLHILSKNSVLLLVHSQLSKIQSKFCKKKSTFWTQIGRFQTQCVGLMYFPMFCCILSAFTMHTMSKIHILSKNSNCFCEFLITFLFRKCWFRDEN